MGRGAATARRERVATLRRAVAALRVAGLDDLVFADFAVVTCVRGAALKENSAIPSSAARKARFMREKLILSPYGGCCRTFALQGENGKK